MILIFDFIVNYYIDIPLKKNLIKREGYLFVLFRRIFLKFEKLIQLFFAFVVTRYMVREFLWMVILISNERDECFLGERRWFI